MTKDFKYLILIVAIFISAVIETDIYLPSFPDMMVFFNQSQPDIQKLLTWNFLGLCLSGPLYGPLSDCYGRRKLLLLALIVFLLGSLITLWADSFTLMLLARVLQGLGSGGCFTLGTAIIFDIFQKEKAIEALNKINMLVPFIMAAAPLLGGYLNAKYGFRANFAVIAVCVSISFSICLFFLEETLPQNLRNKFEMRGILLNFLRVITNLEFVQLTTIISLVFAGFLLFLSSSALLFVADFGVSKFHYPYYQFSLLLAYLGSSLSCTLFVKRKGIAFVKRLGLLSIFLGCSTLAGVTFWAPKNPMSLTLAMLPYSCGFIWVQTPYVTELMALMPDIKGIVASLLTSLRLLITAGIIGLTAEFYNATISPITIAITFISGLICLLSFSYEQSKAAKE
ncbi:MFS transporter [Candidatus Odyssella thessalonicensis]|uniref:MFS transporter n=1 Tax=Candidatus Odyssella thessalonicensis TaxID=84647 RepID=UPI000225B736|nr:MFS transporter [Candidatus Odyssella thessalonicensis]